MLRATTSILVAILCTSLVGCGSDGTETTTEGPLGDGPYPVADLNIAVSHPERELSYRISCQGDTATLSGDSVDLDAQNACRALATAEVRDLLLDGPPVDRVCTEIFGGPDVATISGTLDGAEVDVTIDRANGCGIDDWDIVLAGVLPAALGVTDTSVDP